MTATTVDPDARIRAHVYDAALKQGTLPSIAALCSASGLAAADVRASLARLATGRVVVLQPDSGEILMANPFSAVPTPFVVETTGYTTFGNCIWDAMGIPAMLHRPVRIRTACGCCGEAMTVDVADDRLAASTGVVHFAIPAMRWWDDIVFA